MQVTAFMCSTLIRLTEKMIKNNIILNINYSRVGAYAQAHVCCSIREC